MDYSIPSAAELTETPEFRRQNREFAAAAKNAGKPETFETLGNPYGLLGGAILRQMKLKTA